MWLIYALLTGWIYAAYYMFNQDSKLKADLFIIYRGFLPALVATPLALFFHHTFAWQFYAIVLFQGISIAYIDYNYFLSFHKFGAENVNAVKPLTLCITFVLWLIFQPSMILEYANEPLRTLIIILALAAMIFAIIKYRHQKIGKQCLKEILPLLFISSSIDISNKIIMDYAQADHLLILTFHRVAFTGWIVAIINLLMNFKNKDGLIEAIKWQNIRKSGFIVLLVLSMITTNLAMHYTPNPAYSSAIMHLSLIWIILINKFRSFIGKQVVYQPIDRKWILLLLAAAIVLVLATQK